jgi:hypothetical protein
LSGKWKKAQLDRSPVDEPALPRKTNGGFGAQQQPTISARNQRRIKAKDWTKTPWKKPLGEKGTAD